MQQKSSGVQGLLTLAEIIPYESDPANTGVESMNFKYIYHAEEVSCCGAYGRNAVGVCQ